MNTKIYLSGRFSAGADLEKEWLKRTGCKHRCFSFAFVCPAKVPGMVNNKNVAAALDVCEKAKVNIMMDSGAHSLHVIDKASAKRGTSAKKKQTVSVHELQNLMFDEYVKYVHANRHKWKFYVTLDYVKHQPTILAMQERFKAAGLAPTPVYHGDSSLDWMLKHMDMGHKLICIGGAVLHPGKKGLTYYLDKVFNFVAKHDLQTHGLALTSLDIISKYPFTSVDSSTWSRVASFGQLLMPDLKRKKFFNVHVSPRGTAHTNTMHNMSQHDKDKLTSMLKDHNFDINTMREDTPDAGHARHDWNGYLMSNLPKFGVTQNLGSGWGTLL